MTNAGGSMGTIRRWARIVSEFAFAQSFAQIAGMVTGLIFVRTMPVGEYALFAMAMTALALVSVGSDLGLNGSLSYFWRQAIAERRPVESKIAAVRKARSLMFIVSLAAGVGVLVTSAVTQAASTVALAMIILVIAVAGWLQLHNGIGLVLLRLRGHQRQSYNCEIAGNLVRLLGAGAMIGTGLTTAWFGLAVGLAGAATVTLVISIYRMHGASLEKTGEEISAQDWREIRTYLLPVLPAVLVYMAQDPLVYWFTAQRAGASAVAEVFALSRIGAILALPGTFVFIVMTPRLAGIGDHARYLRTLAGYFVGMSILAAGAVLFVTALPEVPLWLIGDKYAHLRIELLVAVTAVALTIPTALVVLSNRIRGWIALDPIMACVQLALIMGLCLTWDFSSTLNVVVLSFVLTLAASASAGLVFLAGILRPSLVLVRDRSNWESRP